MYSNFRSHLVKGLMAAGLPALMLMASSAKAGGPEYSPGPTSGFYIEAGVNGAGMQSAQSSNVSLAVNGETGFTGAFKLMPYNSMNFSWGGGIGWQFNSVFRLDLNYLYMNIPVSGTGWNNISTIGQTPPASFVGGTSFFRATGTSNMGFVDAYLDIANTLGFSMHYFFPYVGAGAGFSRNHLFNVLVSNVTSTNMTINNGLQTNFAWRAIAGVTLSLTQHLQAFTQYNYISAGDFISGSNLSIRNLPNTGTVSTPVKFHIYSNLIGAGLTYLF